MFVMRIDRFGKCAVANRNTYRGKKDQKPDLAYQILYQMTMHVSESEISPLAAIGQSFVIDT